MIAMKQLFKGAGVKLRTGHKLSKVENDTAILEGADGKKKIHFDTLVVSLGVMPDREEADRFTGLAGEVFCIGDCAIESGSLYTATHMGFNAGMDV